MILQLWLRTLPVVSLLSLVQCSQRTHQSGVLEGGPAATAAQSAMTEKCVACHGEDSISHGGINYITNLPKLVESGKVIRGAMRQTSPIRVRLESATSPMPPVVKPIPVAESKAIQTWILADSPLTGAEADAAKVALEKNCLSCHGPTTAGLGEGGINYITDLAKLVEKGKVKRGDEVARKKSRILVRLLNAGNPMPPVVPALTAEEKAAIIGWIDADSPL